jgi:hypothetical protein
MRLRLTIGALFIVLASCGGAATVLDGAAPATDGATPACTSFPTTGDLPCDVAAVLVAKCQACHRQPPRDHAPFPLVTFEDLAQPFGQDGLRRWQRVGQVIEPGDRFPMPLAGAPPLDAQEHATLRAWVAACAPPQPEAMGCDGH